MNMKKPGRTCTGNPNSRNAGRDSIARAYAAAKVPPTDSDRVHSILVPYVYAFDHKHRRPPMEKKDLLGGKGANLAEMTSVLEAAGAARLHDLHRRLPRLHGRRLAGRARRRDRQARRQAREGDGPQARRRRRPAAGQRALRRQVLDARDDGHGPQPRPQRREREGPAPRHRRRALRLRLATAGSSRCTAASCSASTASTSTSRSRRPRRRPGSTTDAEHPRRGAEGAVRALQGRSSRRRPASRSRRIPTSSCAAPSRPCSASWNGARAIAYRVRERISHDLGTAVNVQAMVFGNRDDNSRHRRRASPATPPPARTSPTATSSSTPRARTSWPASATPRTSTRWQRHFPKIHAELLDIFDRLERALPRHVRHRVHHRAGQALDAADARRQAHRRRRAAHGRRHDQGHRQGEPWKITQAGGDHARHRRPPRPGAAPAVRRQASEGDRQGPGGLAGRGGRQGLLHRRRRRRRRRARREGHPRAQRDQPRGRPRDDGAEGILTARGGLVSHAAVVARGWGTPAVVGRRAMQDRRQASSPSATSSSTRATSSRSTAPPARSCSARWRSAAAEPPAEFAHDPRLGRRRSARASSAVRANADNGPDAANARQFGAEGIGLCRTEHMFLGEDRLPVVRRMILAAHAGRGGRRPRGAARASRRPTSRRSSRRWTACPSPCACSTRRCTSSCPSSTSCEIKQATDGLTDEEERAARRRPRRGTSSTRCSAPAACASACVKPGLYAMQVRALMEAAAERVGQGRQADRRDHDPAHRHPRGAGAGPRLGARTRSTRRPPGVKKKPKVTIGTMIETPRAALRADEIAEEADFFSLRHQRPHADDVRLQPRRRREPDDAGLPRAGPAEAQPVRDDRPDRRGRARAHRRRARPRRRSPT